MDYRITHTLTGLDATADAGDRLTTRLAEVAPNAGPTVSTNRISGLVTVTLALPDTDAIAAGRTAYVLVLDALGPENVAHGRVTGVEIEELGAAAAA